MHWRGGVCVCPVGPLDVETKEAEQRVARVVPKDPTPPKAEPFGSEASQHDLLAVRRVWAPGGGLLSPPL